MTAARVQSETLNLLYIKPNKLSQQNMKQSLNSTTVVLFQLIVTAIVLVDYSHGICPDFNNIRPCTCDDEGLQCLKLNNSGLARVFSAPADLKAIRRVWIFQTNLTELPANAFGDYIIRDLYLDLNQISRVESGAFGEATKTLQSLSLTRNSLNSFPFHDLTLMKKLKQLGLGHNKLTRIESMALPASDSLESLDLSHNMIEVIEANAFAQLSEISLIDLSKNRLKTIASNALLVKSSDKQLAISLRGNQINAIAVDAFGEYHPNSLDLSRNNLTYLDQLSFEYLLTNNTTIFVDENPFSCDSCELFRWLLELDKNSMANLMNFVCTDDTKLEDLTLDMIGCSKVDYDQ